ncbi:MAG: hypothetical protein ACFFCQ_17525 [Promethearchaeota archaeon]
MGKFEDILESGKSQNEILEAIADWLISDFGNIHFSAIFLKQDGEFKLVVYGAGNPPAISEFPLTDPVYGKATQGKIIMIDKADSGAQIFFTRTVSTLTMPILHEKDMKGIIHVGSMFVNAFKQTDLIFFSKCIRKLVETLQL